ncbi:MAG: GH1 family beta-glucosidase [Opitutaceae bacterium]|jgi:beta-glucosidase
MTSPFPSNFTWGAAAASYQVEGAWQADDKGESVWDMLTHQPGRIFEGHTGDVACDHFHRYKEDVALMTQVGLQSYRLSVSWPRVMPAGTGKVSEAGLGFYDRLVDELLATGIQPWVTLFHWDYPTDLFMRGGWLNPESPKWFADYTAVVVDRLSDRVSRWITLNEPQCFIGLGHLTGEHAPGLKLGLREVLQAGHHSLIAHGMSVQTIRARAKTTPSIGWAPVGCINYPVTESPADVAAAYSAMDAVWDGHCWNNRWWGDAPVLGSYPEQGLKAYGKNVPKFKDADFDIIKQPLDFYGCNIYHGTPTKAGPNGEPVTATLAPGFPHTHFLWKRTDEALYWGSKFLAERYKLPIVITENGLTLPDWVSLDGCVHDAQRIDFLQRYLRGLKRAIDEGVDVRGYFQWSIMDNFEWAEGYKHRFGLIHVDYETQKRTLKDSAYWYRDLIRSHGATLSDLPSVSSATPFETFGAESAVLSTTTV